MNTRVQQRTTGEVVSIDDDNKTENQEDDDIQWIEVNENSDTIDGKK